MGQSNVRDLGVCAVEFNGVSLGKTFGSVIFREELISGAVEENESGNVDDIITGSNVSVEVPLSRVSLAQLAAVMPHATYDDVAGTLTVANPVNYSLAENAAALVIKPIAKNEASTDESTWLTVTNAAPLPNIELTYDKETQRVFNVTFKGYPDANGDKWKIGA